MINNTETRVFSKAQVDDFGCELELHIIETVFEQILHKTYTEIVKLGYETHLGSINMLEATKNGPKLRIPTENIDIRSIVTNKIKPIILQELNMFFERVLKPKEVDYKITEHSDFVERLYTTTLNERIILDAFVANTTTYLRKKELIEFAEYQNLTEYDLDLGHSLSDLQDRGIIKIICGKKGLWKALELVVPEKYQSKYNDIPILDEIQLFLIKFLKCPKCGRNYDDFHLNCLNCGYHAHHVLKIKEVKNESRS